MPKVYQHAAARRDLVEHFIYLAESAGLEIAEQFLTDAEASFNALAERPMIGTPLMLRHPDLASIPAPETKKARSESIWLVAEWSG